MESQGPRDTVPVVWDAEIVTWLCLLERDADGGSTENRGRGPRRFGDASLRVCFFFRKGVGKSK
jgi:transposase